MDWGSGKAERFGSYQVNLGKTVNTFVRKPPNMQRWDIVHWIFKDETAYKAVRNQLDIILRK